MSNTSVNQEGELTVIVVRTVVVVVAGSDCLEVWVIAFDLVVNIWCPVLAFSVASSFSLDHLLEEVELSSCGNIERTETDLGIHDCVALELVFQVLFRLEFSHVTVLPVESVLDAE